MKKTGKSAFVTALTAAAIMLTSVLPISAEGASAQNWYVMGNTAHARPLLGADQKFIENYSAVYLGDLPAPEGENSSGEDGGSAAYEKVIYLTFDAGYENGNVAKVLDALKKHNAPGAFFVLEHLVTSCPELIKRMADEGHLVCNHTSDHRDMSKVTSKDEFAETLNRLEDVCRETTGCEIAPFYRPPEGRFTELNLAHAEELGYTTVFWSFAYADWDNDRQPDIEAAKKKILAHVHPGEIMLLHPTSATNAAILDELLSEIEAMGYRFGSLDELTAAKNGIGEASDLSAAAAVSDGGDAVADPIDGGRIALTFDDGPHPVYTPQLLDLLKRYDIPATFFTVGENVRLYPEIVLRELSLGHEIGNHTYTHPCLRTMNISRLCREIDSTEEALFETADFRPYLFRPPEGYCTEAVRAAAEDLGCIIVLWDVDTLDWAEGTRKDQVVCRILDNVKDGDIILCHDYVVRRDGSVTVSALEKVIPELIRRGFEFVRVSELDSFRDKTIVGAGR